MISGLFNQTTYWAQRPVTWPWFVVFSPSPRMTIGMNRLRILTDNFHNVAHFDTMDGISEDGQNSLSEIFSKLMDDIPNSDKSIDNFIRFLSDFGMSVHTTCSYQFPADASDACNDGCEVTVGLIFLNLGMGSCVRGRDVWSHIFYANGFVHCTAMPIFLEKNRVFFGKHPRRSVLAWGGGGTSEEQQRATQIHNLWLRDAMARIVERENVGSDRRTDDNSNAMEDIRAGQADLSMLRDTHERMPKRIFRAIDSAICKVTQLKASWPPRISDLRRYMSASSITDDQLAARIWVGWGENDGKMARVQSFIDREAINRR